MELWLLPEGSHLKPQGLFFVVGCSKRRAPPESERHDCHNNYIDPEVLVVNKISLFTMI